VGFESVNLVLTGMPGSGKGTQAAMLAEFLGVPRVSTGDILREAVRDGSTLGKKVRVHLEAGTLVPDEVLRDLVAERLNRPDAARGFILDGFPRTVGQVAMLDRLLERRERKIDRVFLLTAPADEIVHRLTGRRVCPSCGAVFHLDNRPPKSAGVCDRCGSALVQRADDRKQVILERLEVYGRETLPLTRTYSERGLLHEVNGTGHPQVVFARLKAGLED
jgi:adenylate kinase